MNTWRLAAGGWNDDVARGLSVSFVNHYRTPLKTTWFIVRSIYVNSNHNIDH
jgi:hypothetical protein